MKREFDVLSKLAAVYTPAPKPILFCDDVSVIGSEFYLMDRRHGLIIRGRSPEASVSVGATCSVKFRQSFIRNLAGSARFLITTLAGLGDCGSPRRLLPSTGGRMGKSVTSLPRPMNCPTSRASIDVAVRQTFQLSQEPSLVHNDYKFDNLNARPVRPYKDHRRA